MVGSLAPVPAETSSRREQLRAAAATVFAQRGYHGASMQDVADAVGIRKASVYKHYASKQDLLFALLETAHGQGNVLRRDIRAHPGPPAGRLHEYLRRHVLWHLDDPALLDVCLREWESPANADRRALVARRRRTYERFLRGLVRDCQVSGEADPRIDPRHASLFVLGAVTSAASWVSDPTPETADEVARAAADLAIVAIRSPP
jgi:AcrR family transcriptional regulator